VTARGLLLDLDDTLYATAPAERTGREAVFAELAPALGRTRDEVERLFLDARAAVHERLGSRASSHSRLLYLAELVHRASRPDLLARVRDWERLYWAAFLSTARLRPGALELVTWWREGARGRLAIVTDLTLDVQLAKLSRFGLLERIDALVTSEEVPLDKPSPELLRLAIARLGTEPNVVAGDRDDKDGAAARALGLRFVRIDPAAEDLTVYRAELEAR
jgi:putative hydrolase of the HAD superfamily